MNRIDIARVDLNLLKVFEALYEEGGASRAAIRLDQTQSAVSAALRRLRTLYRDPLFTRTGRGLMPTARADELKPVIGETLDHFRQTLTMTSRDAQDYRGRSVSIGLSDDFEIALAKRLMDAVAKLAPGLRLIFRQTHSHIVADALLDRELDLAIASGGFSSRGLSRQALGEGAYSCLVDPLTVPASDYVLSLDDYTGRQHILVSSGGVTGIVDEALADVGQKRHVAASTTHFAALPYLLKGSNAVATIPTHAALAVAALTGLLVMPCPVFLPRYPIELGWRTVALRDSAVIAVQGAIVACFEPG